MPSLRSTLCLRNPPPAAVASPAADWASLPMSDPLLRGLSFSKEACQRTWQPGTCIHLKRSILSDRQAGTGEASSSGRSSLSWSCGSSTVVPRASGFCANIPPSASHKRRSAPSGDKTQRVQVSDHTYCGMLGGPHGPPSRQSLTAASGGRRLPMRQGDWKGVPVHDTRLWLVAASFALNAHEPHVRILSRTSLA